MQAGGLRRRPDVKRCMELEPSLLPSDHGAGVLRGRRGVDGGGLRCRHGRRGVPDRRRDPRYGGLARGGRAAQHPPSRQPRSRWAARAGAWRGAVVRGDAGAPPRGIGARRAGRGVLRSLGLGHLTVSAIHGECRTLSTGRVLHVAVGAQRAAETAAARAAGPQESVGVSWGSMRPGPRLSARRPWPTRGPAVASRLRSPSQIGRYGRDAREASGARGVGPTSRPVGPRWGSTPPGGGCAWTGGSWLEWGSGLEALGGGPGPFPGAGAGAAAEIRALDEGVGLLLRADLDPEEAGHMGVEACAVLSGGQGTGGRGASRRSWGMAVSSGRCAVNVGPNVSH